MMHRAEMPSAQPDMELLLAEESKTYGAGGDECSRTQSWCQLCTEHQLKYGATGAHHSKRYEAAGDDYFSQSPVD